MKNETGWRRIGLLVCCCLLCFVFADGKRADDNLAYGILIDAGSSGSRVYVYEWEPRISDSPVPPLSSPLGQLAWSKHETPGISEYDDNPEDVGDCLGGLIQFAQDVLQGQEVRFREFPIFLKATAGLRLLPYKKRKTLMRHVQAYLSTTPFKFKANQAKVISGEEEGVFGWLSINFLLGTLSNKTHSYGTLDLGGASTQITFAPGQQEDILDGLYTLDVGLNVSRRLYTHSYLGFGVNQALWRLSWNLVRRKVVRGVQVGNPCQPKGYQSVIMEPLEEGVLEIHRHTFNMVGTGDYERCYELAKELIPKNDVPCMAAVGTEEAVNADSCSFLGVYQPKLSGKFYAFSAFAYVVEYMGLKDESSLDEIQVKARKLCSKTWIEIKARPHWDQEDTRYLHNYCFIATYMRALLVDGYGFRSNTTEITFAERIGDFETTFALGAMLYESNRQSWVYRNKDVRMYKDLLIGVCLAWALSLVVGYAIYYNKKLNYKRKYGHAVVHSADPGNEKSCLLKNAHCISS